MTRNLWVVPVFLLLTAGCGMLTTEQDPSADEQASSTQASENRAVVASSVKPMDAAQDRAGELPVAKPKALTADEIRLIQVRLKGSGFDPGPVDGILGPKTKSVLVRVQAACSTLRDLLEDSEISGNQQDSGIQAPKKINVKDGSTATEEIQPLQARLKSVGFDPGPVDGAMGHKTKTALARLRSSCAMVSGYPAAFEVQSTPVETSAITAAASKKPSAPALARPIPNVARGEVIKPTSTAPNAPDQDEVRLIQVRLKEAGYDPGPVDGVLGAQTRSAVQKYRASRGAQDFANLMSGVDFRIEN